LNSFIDLDLGGSNLFYKWYTTHHLVMMHVSMNFHEIVFVHLEVVVRTTKKAYLTFDLY